MDLYEVELEVHADINTDPNFQSNVALKEAMGYILGMGFVFKAKPHAFASSSCAGDGLHCFITLSVASELVAVIVPSGVCMQSMFALFVFVWNFINL